LHPTGGHLRVRRHSLERAEAAARPDRVDPVTTLAVSRVRRISLAAVLLLGFILATGRPAEGQPPALDTARTLARTGHLDEAVAAYTTLLEAHPEDLEVRKERARVLGWLHRHAEALEDYDRVLAVTPRDVEAALARARVLGRLDRIEEAEHALRAAVADHPDLADAHLALGVVLLRRGQIEGATAAFARARALDPDDPAPLVGLGRARAAAGDAGGAAVARHEALAAFDRRLARNPSDRDARVGRAQLLAGLGRDAEALAEYDRVRATSTRDVEAVLGRVPLLLRQGKLEDAEAAARDGVALDPRSADAWVALGDVLSRRRQFDEATRAYAEARALAPRAVEPVLGLARLRLWQDDPAGARAAYEEALVLDPGNEDAVDALTRIARAAETGAPRRFRLYLTGRYEALDGRTDWTQATVVLGVRPRPGTSFFVGLDQYHRNDRDDTQVSVGAGQALPGNFAIAGSFAHGIDAEVIARQIYEVEVTRPLAPWITPSLRFRWSDFVGDVHAAALSPGIELTWQTYLAVLLRYYFTHSSDAGNGHAGSVRVSLFPEDRWSVYGSLAYGRETYLADTVEDVVRGLDVLTLAIGTTWRIRDGLGVRLDYEYEDRRGSYTKHGVGVGVILDF
jgi:YaiO family outer membrane protein